MSARELVLEQDSARAVVDLDRGGRLASLAVHGLELLVTAGPSPFHWGCFPMAPWAGRVRRGRFAFAGDDHALPINFPPHAIHGTVYDVPWADDGDGTITAALGPDWPFAGTVVQRFVLRPDSLRITLEVHAVDRPMPASCGWHPWFRRRLDRGREVELTFDASSMYRLDDDGIPTGELVAPSEGPWDDCFTGLRSPPRLRWPGALSLEVTSECPDLVVFDQPSHAVCVEPQTGPPDALNLAPRVVEPGDPLVAEVTLGWQPA